VPLPSFWVNGRYLGVCWDINFKLYARKITLEDCQADKPALHYITADQNVAQGNGGLVRFGSVQDDLDYRYVDEAVYIPQHGAYHHQHSMLTSTSWTFILQACSEQENEAIASSKSAAPTWEKVFKAVAKHTGWLPLDADRSWPRLLVIKQDYNDELQFRKVGTKPAEMPPHVDAFMGKIMRTDSSCTVLWDEDQFGADTVEEQDALEHVPQILDIISTPVTAYDDELCFSCSDFLNGRIAYVHVPSVVSL
jgi:hypothetical protein